jgi:lipopolysaccharide export system protein LptC
MSLLQEILLIALAAVALVTWLWVKEQEHNDE